MQDDDHEEMTMSRQSAANSFVSPFGFERCVVCLTPTCKPHKARQKSTGQEVSICPECHERIQRERSK